jgi:hypothetical protein
VSNDYLILLFNIVKSVRLEEKEVIIMFTQKQKDLICGIILGDGSIGCWNNAITIYCGHGEKQKDYVEYKLNLLKQELPNYFAKVNIRSKIISFNNKKFLQYYFCKSSKDFLFFYKEYDNLALFVKNIKSDRSVALWFMDDGCVIKSWRRLKNGEKSYSRPSMKLCTHCFSQEDNLMLCDWFYKKYQIKPHILSEKKNNKTYYFLKFNVDETYLLYKKILKNYIECCSSMKKKFEWLINYYK